MLLSGGYAWIFICTCVHLSSQHLPRVGIIRLVSIEFQQVYAISRSTTTTGDSEFPQITLARLFTETLFNRNLQVGKQLINVLRLIARQTTIIQRLLCSTPCNKHLLGLTIHVKSREFNEPKEAWLAQEVHAFIRSTTDDKAIFVNHSGVKELKFSPTF